MEKNSKEHEACKHGSYFVMKVLLFVLCLVAAVQFAVIAKAFTSLNTLSNRLNAVEEEKILDAKSLKSETHERGTVRSKRSIDETEFKKAMVKLATLEGRYENV